MSPTKTSFNLQKFISELDDRCLVKNSILSCMKNKYLYAYCGFDPTAKSLHIGHLIPLTILELARKYGAKIIVVIGSGTTEIGDPTDKSETRKLITKKQINENAANIREQIKKLLNPDFILDNQDWLSEMKALDFIRLALDFSLNNIIKMQTFENRLKNHIHLSVGEVLYPLLQAYDWAILNGLPISKFNLNKDLEDLLKEFKNITDHNENFCCMQVSGSDQYGNMVQGQNYISKTMGIEVTGITANLLTMKSGEKMGKSLAGALYIDKALLSPYDFFQGIINFDDTCARQAMLQLITELEPDEINRKFDSDPKQTKFELACKLTAKIHGQADAVAAEEKSRSIFEERSDIMMDTYNWPDESQLKIKKLVCLCGLTKTVMEAERAIANKALSLDGETIINSNQILEKGNYIISYGKKKHIKIII